jgi:hypothetical protein
VVAGGSTGFLGLGGAVVGVVVGGGLLTVLAGPPDVVDLPMVPFATRLADGVLASLLLGLGESADVNLAVYFGADVEVAEEKVGPAYCDADF